jgi:BirA family transcriptional regulator, biotin operon repressor / biotin---[acetyl-CoA-carboxylase] ligase
MTPTLLDTLMHWPAEAIWEEVSPHLPGFSVEILPTIDSTNSELMRRARAGLSDAVLLVAETQSAGRGRLDRQWRSQRGDSLTFSLGLPFAPKDWTGLSLAVGLSLAESLHPQVGLKWPNDLWIEGGKLGGILIEAASTGAHSYVVIGVGLNIRAQAAEGLRTPPAALSDWQPGLCAADALARVAAPLVAAVQTFALTGFAPLRARFHARDVLNGQMVITSDGVQGMALGVDDSGALCIETSTGVVSVHSSEVSVRPETSQEMR